MRILVFGGETPDFGTIERALRAGAVETVVADLPFGALSDDRAYVFSGWTLDPATRELGRATGERAPLTSSEFDLLLAFVRAPGRTLSRAELVSALRGRAWTYFDRSIDTLVARLRKKIGATHPGSPVRSVRGVGYVFCARVSRLDAAPSAG